MKLLATFEVRVLCPNGSPIEGESTFGMDQQERRVKSDLPAMIEASQEDLQDLLPDGWIVEVEKQ